MLFNYIAMALRQIKRHKLFSSINILGLAVSLAACLVILLYVQYELSMDKFWNNADEIYQVRTEIDRPGKTPKLNVYFNRHEMAHDILSNVSQVEAISFQNSITATVSLEDRHFKEPMLISEPDIVNILDFKVLSGDLVATMNEPLSIALDQTTASKIFGNVTAIGQVITIGKDSYKIGAIFADLPKNTIMHFTGLMTLDTAKMFTQQKMPNGGIMTSSRSAELYIKVKKGTLKKDLPKDLLLINNGSSSEQNALFTPKPLTKIALDRRLSTNSGITNYESLQILILIAALILFMACINFINLSSARSLQRAKEVALRKVLGASRNQIITQFLGEALLLAIFSLLIAIIFAELALPSFNQFMNRDLSFNYGAFQSIATILGLIAFVGIGGGFYPAIILSNFRPVHSLKANHSINKSSSPRLRQGLILLQFIIATWLIISTAVIYAQTQYTSKMDLGFNPHKLLHISGADEALKIEAHKLPMIEQSSLSDVMVLSNRVSASSFKNIADSKDWFNLNIHRGDKSFLETYEVKVLAGRGFRRDALSNENEETPDYVILNDAARDVAGYTSAEEAIGKTIFMNQKELTIIGVIPDLLFRSLQSTANAAVFLNNKTSSLSLRYTGEYNEAIAALTVLWNKMYPGRAFHYTNAEDLIENSFEAEKKQGTILAVFSILAILVAYLGLYGLAHFTAEQRTKEIGIRKVLGASTRQITQLLLWQFSKPILLANFIAWPIAAWTGLGFLEKFPYRYDDVWIAVICIVVSMVSLLASWATVGGQTILIARANPVIALRDE